MDRASQIYATLFKLASESHEAELVKEAAGALTAGERLVGLLKNPLVAWGAGATGLGAAGLGIPLAYSTGEYVGKEEGELVRNLAFGGGLLSGLVAPSVLKSIQGLLSSSPNAEGTLK